MREILEQIRALQHELTLLTQAATKERPEPDFERYTNAYYQIDLVTDELFLLIAKLAAIRKAQNAQE